RGIDDQFWTANPALALLTVNAISTEASISNCHLTAEEKKRYDKRSPLEAIVAAAASAVRERFWTDGAIAEDAHIRLEITETFGAEAFAKVLVIL
ncbi:hypothetical protein, partial [Salmonella enterica]|uniref:hypothetical protein n=1 Tax=Salmonella enterica TaxID=28901 RepID=UPI0022B6994A